MSRARFFSAPFLLMSLFVALSGCQQAAWKAGATADDFKRDELACREKNDDAAIPQCLRDKGWSLANFDAQAGGEDAPASSEPLPSGETLSPPLKADVSRSSDASTPTIAEPQTGASKTTATKPSARPLRPANPLDRVAVQTWWKAGAQAADFQIDADRCLARLGEQHTPDYSKRLYTRATVDCLRERGWYAGRDPVYTPLR